MELKKESRRVKYTQQVLRESLLELMKTRPIEKITVTDICKLADVNRGTFYTYYLDPFDLLSKIEDEWFEEIAKRVKRPANIFPGKGIDYICEMLTGVKEHAEICRVLFGEFGDKEFLMRSVAVEKEAILDDWQRGAPTLSRDFVEYIYINIIMGNIGVIEQWVKNGFKESPAELARLLNQLNNHGLSAYYGNLDKQLPFPQDK